MTLFCLVIHLLDNMIILNGYNFKLHKVGEGLLGEASGSENTSYSTGSWEAVSHLPSPCLAACIFYVGFKGSQPSLVLMLDE